MLCVSFLYVFHLIKFVFCCYRISWWIKIFNYTVTLFQASGFSSRPWPCITAPQAGCSVGAVKQDVCDASALRLSPHLGDVLPVEPFRPTPNSILVGCIGLFRMDSSDWHNSAHVCVFARCRPTAWSYLTRCFTVVQGDELWFVICLLWDSKNMFERKRIKTMERITLGVTC